MIGPNIAAALVAAQAEIPTITKDAKNPHFNSKFASLDGIIAALRPILAKHQLALTQSGEPMEGGRLLVHSTLVHASGESIVASVPVTLVKQDPQGAGAAMTYGRRFSLSALLCIATDEDDDGNTASAPPKKSNNARSAAGDAQPGRAVASRSVGGSTSAPTVASTSTPVPAPTASKRDEDKMWGGKTLGEYTKDELKALITECGTEARFKTLVTSCRAVLNNRVLGITPLDQSDDARVQRMKDDEAKSNEDLFAKR